MSIVMSQQDKNVAEKIIESMVLNEHVSPTAVQEASGFSLQESNQLVAAIEDDGVIELSEIESTNPRLRAMATYIGSTAKKLYHAAKRFSDNHGTYFCFPLTFGKNEASFSPSQRRIEGPLCFYGNKDKVISDSINDLNDIIGQGRDILPAIEIMLEPGFIRFGMAGINYLYKVNLYGLDDDQKEKAARMIYEAYSSDAFHSLHGVMPSTTLSIIKALTQLGDFGHENIVRMEDYNFPDEREKINWLNNKNWVDMIDDYLGE